MGAASTCTQVNINILSPCPALSPPLPSPSPLSPRPAAAAFAVCIQCLPPTHPKQCVLIPHADQYTCAHVTARAPSHSTRAGVRAPRRSLRIKCCGNGGNQAGGHVYLFQHRERNRSGGDKTATGVDTNRSAKQSRLRFDRAFLAALHDSVEMSCKLLWNEAAAGAASFSRGR
jgi:hypothetical protein